VNIITLPNIKHHRNQAIKKHLQDTDKEVIILSCGNAYHTLKDALPNNTVIGLSTTHSYEDSTPLEDRHYTKQELDTLYPDTFNATCGMLPTHLYLDIGKSLLRELIQLGYRGTQLMVPCGSGETINALLHVLPKHLITGYYDPNIPEICFDYSSLKEHIQDTVQLINLADNKTVDEHDDSVWIVTLTDIPRMVIKMTEWYAQFGEDRAIYPVLKDTEKGYFVDVGALDGVHASNTLKFEQLGWGGVAIEPHSGFFSRLNDNRKCVTLNIAVWSENLPSVEFHETAPGGWSRVGGGGKFPTVNVSHPEARTLDTILGEVNAPHPIDLLSIDVEGTENHILSGFNLSKYKPRIVIIEDLTYSGQFDEYFHEYSGVYSWKQGKGGSNIIYCLNKEDYEVVRSRYR